MLTKRASLSAVVPKPMLTNANKRAKSIIAGENSFQMLFGHLIAFKPFFDSFGLAQS